MEVLFLKSKEEKKTTILQNFKHIIKNTILKLWSIEKLKDHECKRKAILNKHNEILGDAKGN